MNKILWNKFLNGQLAVNCRTERQAEKFLRYCEEQGLKWTLIGKKPTEFIVWYEEEQLYYCHEKKYLTYSGGLKGEKKATYKQLFKPEPEQECTFKETIERIQDGEEYECATHALNIQSIKKDSYCIEIIFANENTSIVIPNCAKFTLKQTEPEYMTFDEAARTGKNFKHKDDEEFKNLHDNLINAAYLRLNKKVTPSQLTKHILEHLDEKAWEVEK